MIHESEPGLQAVRDRLDNAALQLLSVARAVSADPGVQLHCLAAVDLLRRAGAGPRRPEPSTAILLRATSPSTSDTMTSATAPDTATLDAALRGACAQLAGLPADVFAHTPVANAAAHARRALELLQGD